MAETKYIKSIVGDFSTGADGERLSDEIRKSAIVTALERVDISVTAVDNCDIIFKDALSAGDVTILDGLVSVHDGSPLIETLTVHLDSPTTSDGRSIFVPARFGSGIDPYMCGSGDKITSPVARGEGNHFLVNWTTAPATEPEKTQVVTWQFLDIVRVAAGGMMWTGGISEDYIDMWIDAPASVVTANGGATGNANKVEIIPSSGLNIVVPAAGDGDWDVDLTPSLHEDSPVPVPNTSGEGYWDWDEPIIGLGTFAPNAAQTGGFDLYDFPNKLVHWIRRLPLLGDGTEYIDPNSVDRPIYPQWQWSMSAWNNGHANLSMSFYLNLARKETK